jgi:hypothetical protein
MALADVRFPILSLAKSFAPPLDPAGNGAKGQHAARLRSRRLRDGLRAARRGPPVVISAAQCERVQLIRAISDVPRVLTGREQN